MYLKKSEILDGVDNIQTVKKIAHNTYEIFLNNGIRIIRYCQTNVITFYNDHSYCVDTGGYSTATTLKRINSFIPCILRRSRGVLYIIDVRGITHIFIDGMIFNSDNTINYSKKILRDREKLLESIKINFDPTMYHHFKNCIGKIQFVSLSTKKQGRVSYYPKLTSNLDDVMDDKCRRGCTLQSYIVKHVLSTLPDEYKKIVNEEYINISSQKTMFTIFGGLPEKADIVSGSEIINAYYNGYGGKTCMSGESSEFVKFYAENPDKVFMIKFLAKGIKARALLWKISDNVQILDRIYPNSGPHIEYIKYYCLKNNIIQRNGNSLPDCSSDIKINDGHVYTIELNQAENGYYPYLDTFHFGSINRNKKTVILSNGQENTTYRFSSTDGDCYQTRYTCVDCGKIIYEGNMHHVHGQVFCNDCFYKKYYKCPQCGVMHKKDELTKVMFDSKEQDWCLSCVRNYSFKCSRCNKLHSSNYKKLIYLENKKVSVCDSCFNKFIQLQCSICKKYFTKLDMFTSVECKKCRDISRNTDRESLRKKENYF